MYAAKTVIEVEFRDTHNISAAVYGVRFANKFNEEDGLEGFRINHRYQSDLRSGLRHKEVCGFQICSTTSLCPPGRSIAVLCLRYGIHFLIIATILCGV